MNVFEFENVSFAYPEQMVLERFKFEVGQGDFVAVVGPNGAGKSTLLKLCVGLLTPAGGQIRIMGQPLTQFKNWVKIGYVPQNPLRDRSFPVTVAEVVSMGRVAPLGLLRRLKKGDYQVIERALKVVGMEDKAHCMIGELSGGQQQRVLIARALAANPEILILDEPTAGVDSTAKKCIYQLLKHLNESLGVTILIVSHDVDGIAKYATKIAKIDHGIRYYGDADKFCQEPEAYIASTWLDELQMGDITHA